jgi:uncharacterized protein (DUF2384 family)
VRAQAERQAQAAGFASVSDYLADLVREDGEADDWLSPPAAISTADELRAAVAVGLASPPVTSVDEMFVKLRRIASGGTE